MGQSISSFLRNSVIYNNNLFAHVFVYSVLNVHVYMWSSSQIIAVCSLCNVIIIMYVLTAHVHKLL